MKINKKSFIIFIKNLKKIIIIKNKINRISIFKKKKKNKKNLKY